MKKIIIGLMAMVLATIGLQIVTTTSASADYQENCIGKVTPRATRSMQHTFTYSGDIYVQALTWVEYWDCLNGSNPRKVRPKNIHNCWNIVGQRGEHEIFAGMFIDIVIDDMYGNIINDPPEDYVPDKLAVQNCVVQDIPLEDERWVQVQNSPGYSSRARVRYFDHIGDYRLLHNGSGGELTLFTPGADVQTAPSFEP